MKSKLFSGLFLFLIATVMTYAQTGKYFTASGTQCRGSKVFIDHRIQQYGGSEFSIQWTGGCKNGFADGNGKLVIKGEKTPNRTFTLVYEGNLVNGKKEGIGLQFLFAYHYQLNPDNNLPWVDPYYHYKGSFKNDEFHGYGEFRASYPYPIDPDDVGKGISMEALELGSPIWRSDL